MGCVLGENFDDIYQSSCVVSSGTTTLWVTGRYHSDKIRHNLIIAATGALQASTSIKASNGDVGSNCYEPPSGGKGKICIVGDVVRVRQHLLPHTPVYLVFTYTVPSTQ